MILQGMIQLSHENVLIVIMKPFDNGCEVILVCEECNNQWEDVVSESDRENLFCPMCGTSRVVII